MAKRSTTVGRDVHKESIDVVIAEAGAEGEVRHYGTIGGDLGSVDRMVKRVRAAGKHLRVDFQNLGTPVFQKDSPPWFRSSRAGVSYA